MNVSEAMAGVTAWFERTASEVPQLLGEHLPALANLADKAAANPAIDAILSSEHISPEWYAALAGVINGAEAALKVAADAKAAAEEAAAAATAPPADPAQPAA